MGAVVQRCPTFQVCDEPTKVQQHKEEYYPCHTQGGKGGTRSFFEEFIQWLKVCRKSCVSTCNQRLGAIHAFFIYLQYEMPEVAAQCQDVLAIRTAKAPEGQLNYLTVEGIAALLAQPNVSTKVGRRDAALLSLLYDSGARVQEIVDLTIGDSFLYACLIY